jgi:hypothetical protein
MILHHISRPKLAAGLATKAPSASWAAAHPLWRMPYIATMMCTWVPTKTTFATVWECTSLPMAEPMPVCSFVRATTHVQSLLGLLLTPRTCGTPSKIAWAPAAVTRAAGDFYIVRSLRPVQSLTLAHPSSMLQLWVGFATDTCKHTIFWRNKSENL